MEYPFYLEQKFFDVGRLETRTLTAQEAEASTTRTATKPTARATPCMWTATTA